MICSMMRRIAIAAPQFWSSVWRELSIVATIQAKIVYLFENSWIRSAASDTDKMEYRHFNRDKSISIMNAMFRSKQNKTKQSQTKKHMKMKRFVFSLFIFSLNSIKLCCTFFSHNRIDAAAAIFLRFCECLNTFACACATLFPPRSLVQCISKIK